MGTSSKGRRHRSWPEAVKREIVAATMAPGASVSLVARRYDVNANQVFAWRRQYRAGSGEAAGVQLMPVTVTPDPPAEIAPVCPHEPIEIELTSGYCIRVGSGAKAATLRLVLDVLERR